VSLTVEELTPAVTNLSKVLKAKGIGHQFKIHRAEGVFSLKWMSGTDYTRTKVMTEFLGDGMVRGEDGVPLGAWNNNSRPPWHILEVAIPIRVALEKLCTQEERELLLKVEADREIALREVMEPIETRRRIVINTLTTTMSDAQDIWGDPIALPPEGEIMDYVDEEEDDNR